MDGQQSAFAVDWRSSTRRQTTPAEAAAMKRLSPLHPALKRQVVSRLRYLANRDWPEPRPEPREHCARLNEVLFCASLTDADRNWRVALNASQQLILVIDDEHIPLEPEPKAEMLA
jgi:hypothetical protein